MRVPGPRRLTDLVRSGLDRHKDGLVRTVETRVAVEVRQALDDLFAREDGISRYRPAPPKKTSQSMQPRKIAETAADFKAIPDMCRQIAPVLNVVNIDLAGIRFFAGAARRLETFQLRRRSGADRHLRAIAFIARRHRKPRDAPVDMPPNVMATFEKSVKRERGDQVSAKRQSAGKRLETVPDTIDANALHPPRQIRRLADDDALSNAVKLDRVGTILDQGREDTMAALQKNIRESGSDDGRRQKMLEAKSRKPQNRASPILKQIAFIGDGRGTRLLAALACFREKGGIPDPEMPPGFLAPDERRAVSNASDGFGTSPGKVCPFQHMDGAVKAGNLNLAGSCKYRPMDECLIGRDRWEREKPELFACAGLSEFADPRSVLNALNTALHGECRRANRAAVDGSNPCLKVVGPGNFHVRTFALVHCLIHLISFPGASSGPAYRTPQDPPGRGSTGTAARPWRCGAR